jgi:hypothetical protein
MHLVVVFDLDNTLLHTLSAGQCANLALKELAALDIQKIVCHRSDGTAEELFVKLRPGAHKCLCVLAEQGIPVYINSAGKACYVSSVMQLLDPSELIPKDHVFNRTHMEGNEHKQVSLIAQHAKVDYQNILIVDDRRDVWRKCGAEANVLQVPPYIFTDFQLDESDAVLDGALQYCLEIQSVQSSQFIPTVAAAVDFGYRTMLFDCVLLVDPQDLPAIDSWLDGKRHGFHYVTTWSAQVTHVLCWSWYSAQVCQTHIIPFTKRPILVAPTWLWESIIARRQLDVRDFPVQRAALSSVPYAHISVESPKRTMQNEEKQAFELNTTLCSIATKRWNLCARMNEPADMTHNSSTTHNATLVSQYASKR